jgi:predicted O-methyltransferase YrrM
LSLRDVVASSAYSMLHSNALIRRRFPDVDARVLEIFARVKAFTMTSPERIMALCEAVKYVAARGIAGDIVECGVWRGGSSMAAALMLAALGKSDRDLYLFDTFEGMSAPGENDRRARDAADAAKLLETSKRDEKIWCYSPLDEVRTNLASTGYPAERVRFVQGKVEDTLPGAAPDQIAILRLDTDWYESTRHELEHLFPRLSVGGVLIIDDYGAWEGARRAVDEYFERTGAAILLNRIDETGRIGVKTAA